LNTFSGVVTIYKLLKPVLSLLLGWLAVYSCYCISSISSDALLIRTPSVSEKNNYFLASNSADMHFK